MLNRSVPFTLFTLLAAFLATASIAPALRATEEKVVPTEMCRGLFLVPVTFDTDPERSLVLVLDTGAGRTSVDPDAIERVTGRRIKPGQKATLRRGEAGPLKLKRFQTRVHEMDHLARALGRHVDGILGFPTFQDLLLTLDYPAEEVRVSKGELAEPDGQRVFHDVGKRRPHLALELPEGARVPVLVDSGSTGGLDLRRTDPLEWERPPRPVAASVRYDAIRVDEAGRLARDIAYGPLVLERPVVEAIDDDATRLAGYRILRRFVWTFDGRNRRIRMVPDSAEPIRFDAVRGTGLTFRPRERGMEIVRVLDDTPAERTDVREGDLVTAIDFVPVYERGCVSMIDDTRETTTLTVERDGASMDIEVRIAVLVP